MKHIPFPSIDQFRSVVKHVNDKSNHKGIPRPTLSFHGTTKLHGTNSAFVVNDWTGEVWQQSRERIITPDDDNAGFSAWANQVKQFNLLQELVSCAAARAIPSGLYLIDNPTTTVVIYGEWCGGSIQKGVALNQLEKMFVVFGIKFLDEELPDKCIWLSPTDLKLAFGTLKGQHPDVVSSARIFCIEDFPTWDIKIDFSNPAAKQNELITLTEVVEAKCPVGAHFGVEGVGEGIVWSCTTPGWGDQIFKVKGEKHSSSKVKTLAAVDVEVQASIEAFVESVCTENRLEQGLGLVSLDQTSIGPFLKWVGNDVIKEESDTMAASGLEQKQVMGAVNRKARDWFLNRLNKEVM